MRVALVTETFLPHIDGVVTRLVYTIEALRAAGDEVLVIAPERRGLPSDHCGARVVGAPSVPLPVYREFRLGLPLTAGIDAVISDFHPDIIHVVNPAVLGLAGFSYARRHGTPVMASYHTHLATYAHRYGVGFLAPVIWRYVRWLHNQAQLNLCTSRPVQDVLNERGLPRVALWAPGVDSVLFSPERRTAAMRVRLTGGQPAETLLLYVGRLATEKSLEWLAPALAELPGCHLALVGKGPARQQLEAAFTGLPVTFVGPLHGEELATAYASADIFAFPSCTETLGLAAIEAMAAGLPVVGAGRGGVPYVVRDGETGLLFDPDAPGDLVRALRALVADAALREQMGRAGRRRAEGWSWAASTAGLRDYYRSIILASVPRSPVVSHEDTTDASSAPTL